MTVFTTRGRSSGFNLRGPAQSCVGVDDTLTACFSVVFLAGADAGGSSSWSVVMIGISICHISEEGGYLPVEPSLFWILLRGGVATSVILLCQW